MKYEVQLTENAKADIAHFETYNQRIIAAGILTHLKIDAEFPTKRKKPLRDHLIAPWELRIGRFRVFYTIEEGEKVKVVAVAHKEHNELFIRGRKVEL